MGLKKVSLPHTSDMLVAELVAVIKDLSIQQNKVLEAAMAAQVAQAEVLSNWMKLFQPGGPPTKSTTEEERILHREATAAETEWEPFDAPALDELFPTAS